MVEKNPCYGAGTQQARKKPPTKDNVKAYNRIFLFSWFQCKFLFSHCHQPEVFGFSLCLHFQLQVYFLFQAQSNMIQAEFENYKQ